MLNLSHFQFIEIKLKSENKSLLKHFQKLKKKCIKNAFQLVLCICKIKPYTSGQLKGTNFINIHN